MIEPSGVRTHQHSATEEHLYRIVLEALHNTVKHARATQAQVTVACHDDVLTIEVADNGVGFDPGEPRPGHLGLHTMTERADAIGGSVDIRSESGAGTRVVLTVPIGARAGGER